MLNLFIAIIVIAMQSYSEKEHRMRGEIAEIKEMLATSLDNGSVQ